MPSSRPATLLSSIYPQAWPGRGVGRNSICIAETYKSIVCWRNILSWKMETLRRIYAKPHNNNRCSVVSCAQGIAQITLAPGNRFIRDMLFYEGNHTIWERSEKNSTYITEISLPALCLLLLIAGLRKPHRKDSLRKNGRNAVVFHVLVCWTDKK